MSTRAIDRSTGVVTTTDATQTTVQTHTVPTGATARLEARVVARKSNGDSAAFMKAGLARDVAGTLTLVGSVLDIIAAIADVALATASVTLDVSGNTVRVRVTGVAATTIEWFSELTLHLN